MTFVQYPYEKYVYSSVLLVYFLKYTFSLLFMYFSDRGFMYFSEIYLKWHLSILDLYFEKYKYIWAIGYLCS